MLVESFRIGPKRIEIEEIEKLSAEISLPLYVLVAGGIATGKSHVVDKYIMGLNLVDVDNFMAKLGYTDYTPWGPQLTEAMERTGDYVRELKTARQSIIAMGTCSRLEWARQRLVEAKRDAYATVLLHIVVPNLEQALEQNLSRRESGRRAVNDCDIDIIRRTREESDFTVRSLLNESSQLIDFYVRYENERT